MFKKIDLSWRNIRFGYLFLTNVHKDRLILEEYQGWIFIPHNVPTDRLNLHEYYGWIFIPYKCSQRETYPGGTLGLDIYSSQKFKQIDLTFKQQEHSGWTFIPHKSSNRQTLTVGTFGLDIYSSQMFQQTYLSGRNIRVGYLFSTKVSTDRLYQQEHQVCIFITHTCSNRQTYPVGTLGLNIYSPQMFKQVDLTLNQQEHLGWTFIPNKNSNRQTL